MFRETGGGKMFVERPSAPPEGGYPFGRLRAGLLDSSVSENEFDSGVASCCIPLGADSARAVSRVTK